MKRLISFIVIFVVFLAFIVLNLENKSDVSFGFVVFQGIPVFLTVFFAFVFGLVSSIPLFLRRKKPASALPAGDEQQGGRWGFGKKRDVIHKEDGTIKKDNEAL